MMRRAGRITTRSLLLLLAVVALGSTLSDRYINLEKRREPDEHGCAAGHTWRHRICLMSPAAETDFADVCDRGVEVSADTDSPDPVTVLMDPFPAYAGTMPHTHQGIVFPLWPRNFFTFKGWPLGEIVEVGVYIYLVVGKCPRDTYCFTTPPDLEGSHHILCVPHGQQYGATSGSIGHVRQFGQQLVPDPEHGGADLVEVSTVVPVWEEEVTSFVAGFLIGKWSLREC